MSSIFIWKADMPIISQTTVRYYLGANWFLQENEHNSFSYLLTDQHLFSTNAHPSVLVYNGTCMPPNWVGSELLEVMDVPYQLIKEDNYGKLEQLGMWMRCILYTHINEHMYKDEFMNVIEWSKAVNGLCVKQPYVMQPFVMQPFVKQPYVTQPYVKQPYVKQPYVKQPYVKQPYVKQPYVKQPYHKINNVHNTTYDRMIIDMNA